MARSFRFYEKKRGHRRTGSRQFGRVGELLFSAVLLLIGAIGAGVVVCTVVVPEWRANHEFVPHLCKVLDKRLGEQEGTDGKLYRPEIQIEYEVDGASYRTWTYDIRHLYSAGKDSALAALADFATAPQQGQQPCWYDPLDPSVAVVVRGYSWWMWPVSLVWGGFLLSGAAGLIYTWLHWGKSAERRAALEQRVREGEIFLGNGRAKRDFPYVPDGADITNSPGTRLKFRLPIGTSPAWLMFSALGLCIVWNGIVVVWAALAVSSFRGGQPDWPLTLFLIPFAAVGIGLLAWFIRQLLITTGIGPTHAEISDHPLVPGGDYRLFISQPGRLKFNSLSVALICEEEATFRQGTNTRTESCEVFRQELVRRESFEVQPGTPWEADIAFTAPPQAMHSFKAAHNAVTWKIVVHGDVAGWPDYTRTFPIIVRPAPKGEAS
jgi:hypothetical protein